MALSDPSPTVPRLDSSMASTVSSARARGQMPGLAISARLYRGRVQPLQRKLLARSSYASRRNCQCKDWPMGLMRLSSAVCDIGKAGAVVRTGRIPHPRDLLPARRIKGCEMRVALGADMNFGDFQTIGARHPPGVDFRAADHGDF